MSGDDNSERDAKRCAPDKRGHRRSRLRRYLSHRLQRRLFFWFGVAIFVSGAVGFSVAAILRPDGSSIRDLRARMEQFSGTQFAKVWDKPAERDALAQEIADTFDSKVTIYDEADRPIATFGGKRACQPGRGSVDAPVIMNGHRRGHVVTCPRRSPPFMALLAAMLAAGSVLWAASGLVARRLSRPLSDLVRVTKAIGEGDFGARDDLQRSQGGEVGVLSEAVYDMSERIEKQMRDQRELLASVSHEIRTPLARMRLLLEMARDTGTSEQTVSGMEREILDIDELIGQLLAGSRLDFNAINRRELDAATVAVEALERAGVDPTLLDAPEESIAFSGDATLLARALANLIDNAKKHGGGVVALSVELVDDTVRFAVEDAGPGIAESMRDRVLKPFDRGEGLNDEPGGGSLGLGLALVDRIARAHGGEAFVDEVESGDGALVGFTVSLADPLKSTAPA